MSLRASLSTTNPTIPDGSSSMKKYSGAIQRFVSRPETGFEQIGAETALIKTTCPRTGLLGSQLFTVQPGSARSQAFRKSLANVAVFAAPHRVPVRRIMASHGRPRGIRTLSFHSGWPLAPATEAKARSHRQTLLGRSSPVLGSLEKGTRVVNNLKRFEKAWFSVS